VDGLRRLGTPVTDEEAEAYIHVWNIVGHLLGIPPVPVVAPVVPIGAPLVGFGPEAALPAGAPIIDMSGTGKGAPTGPAPAGAPVSGQPFLPGPSAGR